MTWDGQSGDRHEEQPAPAAPSAGTTVQTLPTDVQAAVSVLGRLPSRRGVLRGDLAGAWLREVNLAGARLAGANLTTAKNLIQQQPDSARGNEDTELPAWLQRPAHWSVAG